MPYNVIPFFLIGLSALFFGLRGYTHYRKTRTPLSFYFGISGILAGISGISYALPFIFTYDVFTLKIMTLVGDFFYYGAILVEVRIIWYLGLKKKISFYWLLGPMLVIQVFNIVVTAITLPNIKYEIVNNFVTFPVAPLASWVFALISTSFVMVGYLTIKEAYGIKEKSQRIRMYMIGSVFGLGGVTAIYNYVFLQGDSDTTAPFIGYSLAALALFVGVFFISRKRSSS